MSTSKCGGEPDTTWVRRRVVVLEKMRMGIGDDMMAQLERFLLLVSKDDVLQGAHNNVRMQNSQVSAGHAAACLAPRRARAALVMLRVACCASMHRHAASMLTLASQQRRWRAGVVVRAVDGAGRHHLLHDPGLHR